MIDFHTHILPHLDDGARNTQTSIEMLKVLQSQGVTTVLATPHYYGKRSSPSEFIKRRNAMFERIQPHIPEGINVRLGAEVHFTGINLPEHDELCKLAIEGTNCILVEFPFTTVWTGELMEHLSDFVRDTDYTPVIAHVERYREVWKNPTILSTLINMGCLLQVNAPAFLDKRERKLAFALLKRGFVHCIGSDAHDLEKRAPDLIAAKETVEKAGLLSAWESAEHMMGELLAGESVRTECAKPLKKCFGLYV